MEMQSILPYVYKHREGLNFETIVQDARESGHCYCGIIPVKCDPGTRRKPPSVEGINVSSILDKEIEVVGLDLKKVGDGFFILNYSGRSTTTIGQYLSGLVQ
jgi:hypothetical protein